MCCSKLIGATIISFSVLKFCFLVDFLNLHLGNLTILTERTLKFSSIKINRLRKIYIEIYEMKTKINESMSFTLPLIMAIIIMCLIRRCYRFYALFTGQLHLSAFIFTLMNNTTEEIAFIFALCYCSDKSEIMMENLLSKFREMDCLKIENEKLKIIGQFYDQVSHQRIEFQLFNSINLNVELTANITYMQNFGYLDSPDINAPEGLLAESLYAENAIVEGIKNLQRFGGLEPNGIVDGPTMELLNTPRCGVKDILNDHERKKRYIIGSKNWKKKKITYFIANFSPKVNETLMITALEKAFHAWSIYSNLVFKRIFDPSADIIIAFGSHYHGDRYPFDGSGNILAHAFYPYEENAFGGDIHFDNDENWKEGSLNLNEGVDFLTVAFHEIGHSLGLAHSPVYSSIMFPYYKGVTAAQLDYDDILGMYQLYIQSQLEDNTSKEENDDKQTEESTTNLPETTSNSSSENSSKSKEIDKEKTTEKQNLSNENEVDSSETNEVSKNEEEDDESISIPQATESFCLGSFDAMGTINDELLIIKSDIVWKFTNKFELFENFPMKISKVFPNLPQRFKKIDAFVQSSDENEINIFSGNEFITYDIRGPIYTAYNLTRYTNDPDIEKIDAAMIWSKNKKTYLFSEDRFWRFSNDRLMDPFYPRIMKRWKGVPKNLTGAISFPHSGPTVFFKDDEFIIYDDENVKPEEGYPKKIYEIFEFCENFDV
ncbi:hypothetical protein PVAND_016981 [Polypedilum vanderplanki]|uniref:Peptidase metallopeptidase domain-containing protein n=1 Tax=Polypedilum vanderplanki TaxID=319348 RepID=A0A9J6BH97_POLVA|nr:hypothetical protein PVAND_016981 [Polypedilum vanderplanki]